MSLTESLRATWPTQGRTVPMALVASLTLGLAPFVPHAHVWKQLVNLWHHRLTAPIDQFDLVLHGAPWVWLLVALGTWVAGALRHQRSASAR